MKIMTLDPGNSTGWLLGDFDGILDGGTVEMNLLSVFNLLNDKSPEIVVYETFNLYPGKAQSLSWNSFYPCETIGVIRLWCMLHPDVQVVKQAPSIKRYSGGLDRRWTNFQQRYKTDSSVIKPTEHTKDAYLHYKYFILNNSV